MRALEAWCPKSRVTKDYTTTVGITFVSLAKAYNTVPDLLSPQLEVGVQLTPQWTLVTPTIVPLN